MEGVYTTLQELIGMRYDAKGFSFLPSRSIHNILAGRHASRMRGRGLDFEEARIYVPGDDVRYIDWKVTARTGQTHTKVYTEERERPVWLVVDLRSNMFFGSVKYTKSVTACHAAALSAWRVLGVGDKIGAVIIGDDDFEIIKPQRSMKNVEYICSKLVEYNQKLKAEYKEIDQDIWKEAFTRIMPSLNHDNLLIVISDFAKTDKDFMKNLIKVKRHNDILLGSVFDPLERELPKTNFDFTDGDKILKFKSSKRNRKAYNEFQNDHYEKLADSVETYGIPLVPINTEEAVSLQLRRMMGYAHAIRRNSAR